MKIAAILIMTVTGAMAHASESPLLTLTKSAATVINGSNRLSAPEALTSALQHGQNERIQVTESCEETISNATTKLEMCRVTFTKGILGSFQGSCGEYSKGGYYFRFLRAVGPDSQYEVRGDVTLEITLR